MVWLFGFFRTGWECCHGQGALQLYVNRWHWWVRELQALFCPAITILVAVTHTFYCSGICGEQRIIPWLLLCLLTLWKLDPEERPCLRAGGCLELLHRSHCWVLYPVLEGHIQTWGKDGQKPSLEGFPKNRDLPALFWLTKSGSLILSHSSIMVLMLQSWVKVSEAGVPLSSIML